MKTVSCEFYNLQSHEFTQFQLKPGLNFILADDNNVGKSTIFKVMNFAIRMPKVTKEDALELLRNGEARAYAMFSFDDIKIILWIIKEGDKVNVFFEKKYSDGTTIREVECPEELLTALDVVKGSNREPINFNDADSVQLVVRDSPQNDEVLSQVLIDLKVERIKENLVELSKTTAQDVKYYDAVRSETERSLSKLTYNSTVDLFNEEADDLEKIGFAIDCISKYRLDDIDTSRLNKLPSEQEFTELKVLTELTKSLSGIDLSSLTECDETVIKAQQELTTLKEVASFLTVLNSIDTSIIERAETLPSDKEFEDLRVACSALIVLRNSLLQSSRTFNLVQKSKEIKKSIGETVNYMNSHYQRVQCPVKGEVYFSNEKCVPCSN